MTVYATVLPGNNISDVDPWLSWVVNLNVLTRLHRDTKDIGWCLDLVITDKDFRGGELGMVELGLVLPLQNGDFCIFRSMDITHFNLEFVGERCSFVFATCKEFASWEKDRHGWESNKFMT